MRTIEELKAARDEAVNVPGVEYWDCKPDELLTMYAAGERDFRWVYTPYGANLSGADLRDANLSGADLGDADLGDANLGGADLGDANLSGADLRDANLSGITGLLDPIEYMNANFERTADGYRVYKSFGSEYPSPARWLIAPGSVITEVTNPDRGTDCGCGINVATRNWDHFQSATIWECLIRHEWLMGVVVPFHTDGKIRTARLELVKEIDR